MLKIFHSLIIVFVLTSASLLFFSCGSPEDNIPGKWITESVEASIDSTKASASEMASIDKAVATAKTTTFTLRKDNSMILIIDGYRSEAFWSYDEVDGMITFLFEAGEVENPIELGKLDGDKIIYTSSIKHGNITSVYVKE
jgi:hypothetical protein